MQPQTDSDQASPALLSGWITRKDLAQALGVTVDTLGRWEARHVGPPCVRAGRMGPRSLLDSHLPLNQVDPDSARCYPGVRVTGESSV